ncbi:MAG: ATP-binding protein, partial [Pseudomonadota bacterium]
SYPSRFQLVAAMNPCRCGMAGEPGHTCRRGERCAADYQARISGPLMDRIDLRVEVPAVSAADLMTPTTGGETSATIASRVEQARTIQAERYAGLGLHITTNALAPNTVIETVAKPDAAGQQLLRDAAEAMKFSARGYHRILKTARTLADLEGCDTVGRIHLAEAISYRMAGQRLAVA